MRKGWRVEKRVTDDENWYYEGTWDNPKNLAYAMFNIGKNASIIEDIRIIETDKVDVVLDDFSEEGVNRE